MLDYNEKQKIKDILSDGLGIKSNIKLSYFLDAINTTNDKVKKLESKIDSLIHNQRVIDDKLDTIIRLIK